jgi:hypothetical protein
LRRQIAISERKLAELSGLTLEAIHSYGLGPKVKGRRVPPLDAVAKIAEALGVTYGHFAQCGDIARKPPAKKTKSSHNLRRTLPGRGRRPTGHLVLSPSHAG